MLYNNIHSYLMKIYMEEVKVARNSKVLKQLNIILRNSRLHYINRIFRIFNQIQILRYILHQRMIQLVIKIHQI